jgi:hypothetical protein
MTPDEITKALSDAGLTVPDDELSTMHDGVAILLALIERLDDSPRATNTVSSDESDAS